MIRKMWKNPKNNNKETKVDEYTPSRSGKVIGVGLLFEVCFSGVQDYQNSKLCVNQALDKIPVSRCV